MPSQIKCREEFQGKTCYQNWLQTPGEVQRMQVDLPGFKEEIFFIPYIETNNFGYKVPMIDIIFPAIFDDKEIKDYIIEQMRINNMFEKGGVQVVQRTNIKADLQENKTKVMVKNLNLPFLKSLFSNLQQTYVESMGDYQHILF